MLCSVPLALYSTAETMATKAKASETKVAVLKGKDAEEKVLEYMKRMNRPFGAVDVSANLKGAVPKTAAQKILVALAERGDLVQKTCEMAKMKCTPTDEELAAEVEKVANAITKARAHLEPLRAGTPLISAEETAQLEGDWGRWRGEWTRRRKIFNTFWGLATDALTPQQATELAEDLGVEWDTPEHTALERGELCMPTSTLGKRRR
ncbi:TBPIP-domain-containing protein [Cerioporus squamosus]|nr:TBPIP-domain-containing protein [Cerioporus squamosus]